MPVNSSSPRHSRCAPAQAPSVRSLPIYVAGDISLPVRVFGNDERIAEDTIWTEHAHPRTSCYGTKAVLGQLRLGLGHGLLPPRLGCGFPPGHYIQAGLPQEYGNGPLT